MHIKTIKYAYNLEKKEGQMTHQEEKFENQEKEKIDVFFFPN